MRWVAAVVALVALSLCARPAGADETEECLRAHVEAQRQRLAGKLRRARELLVSCSQERCPSLVESECSQWLVEVEQSLPTVVFEARAQGRDTRHVRVQIDGEPPLARLPTRAVPIDPGEHVVRFTDPAGRTIRERVIVREGEKNKKVRAVFALEASPDDDGLPAAFFATGIVGIVGIAGFTTLGIVGKVEEGRLERCAPRCANEDADRMYRLYVAADVSLAIGSVALGIAAIVGIHHAVTAP